MLHGFINIEKPAGISSFQATRIAARALGERKAGHAGTLDLFATGVLPVAVGEATKAIRYLHGADKTYIAAAIIGLVTDTLDITGKIVARGDHPRPSDGDIMAALDSFAGICEQVPPVYSALKSGGVRLSDLARAGGEVSPRPRQVRIGGIRLISCDWPRLVFEVTCGAGTYIRSLARDIGVKLGAEGATLEALKRTRYAGFPAESSVLPESAAAGLIVPTVEALAGMGRAAVSAAGELHARQGRPLDGAFFASEGIAPAGERLALIDGSGRLVAVLASAGGRWAYERVFDERR